MYLDKGSRNVLTTGSMALFLLLSVAAIWVAVNPPKFANQADIQAAYKHGQAGVAYQGIEPKTGSKSLLLALAGLAIIPGYTAYRLSDGMPNSLDSTKLVLADTTKPERVEPKVKRESFKDLQQNMLTLCEQHPWFKNLMRAESIILVGPSGAGKSSLAQAIAIFRAVLFKWPLHIYDPDATANIEAGTWRVGEIFGGGDGAFGVQLADGLQESLAQCPGKEGRTIIFDEITGWEDYGVAPEQTAEVYSAGIRLVRRRNVHPIYIFHGTKKGMVGGESIKSGLVSSLLKKSAVITMVTEADTWGETVYKGKATLNFPGVAYKEDSADDTPLAVPEQMAPGYLIETLLKESMKVLEILPRIKSETAAIREEIDAAWGSRESLNNALTRSLKSDGPSPEPTLEQPAEVLDVDSHIMGSYIEELALYLYAEGTAIVPSPEGAYSLRTLWRNKGSKDGRFDNMSDFKAFVESVCTEGAGVYIDRPASWIPHPDLV